MSNINKDSKHVKYEPEWEKNITRLANILAEDEKTKLPPLLTAAKQLNTEQTKLKQEIQKLETSKQDLGDIVGRHRRVSQQLTELATNYSSATKTKTKASFFSNAPNKYDWVTKTKAYYPTTYADNLYEGVVNGVKLKITESEAIQLLTRVIKALEKVDPTKFNTKFTASTHTVGINHLPEIQQLAKDGLKDNLISGKLPNGSAHPDHGKPANHSHLNRLEYSFKSQYVADAHLTQTPSATAFTPQSAETITKTKVDNFFSFIADLSKDGTIKPEFLTELNSDTDILKSVENQTSWKILPAQATPLASSKLADYGIQVANNNHTKLYLSETHDKVVKFTINEGLKSWIELVQAFFADTSQQTKLANSFATDPYTQLLTDLANNTHSAHWELPESLEDLQAIADQIELDKLAAAGQITRLGEKLEEKKAELTTKNGEFASKDTELTTLLTAIISKKREALNQWEIKEFEDKTSSGGQDDRKTMNELWDLERLLLEIRYLENDGDATLGSSITEENTALTTIQEIIGKVIRCWHQSSWDSIGWQKEASELENRTRPNSEKIKLIQANQHNDYPGGLTYYHDQLVELEKLVKLTDQQQQIKADLKTALDNQTPEATLTDWQNSLKKYGLATVFDQTKLDKWKEKKDGQAKFDNLVALETLLKKVCVFKTENGQEVFDKVEEEFITALKKIDANMDTLAKLIEQKDPVEVIKIIVRYSDYDKLSAEDQKKKKQQLVWTLEKQDENGNYLDDAELTEEEITNTLYENEIGKKTLATQKKEDETEDEPSTQNPPKGHLAQYWWVYTASGVGLVGVVALSWKTIKGWWNGPTEEKLAENPEAEND